MFIHTGMLSDETQHTPKDQLTSVEHSAVSLTSMYKLLATDFDKQQNDTNLFPGRCSDEELKKLPPFAIWTSEFDFYRRDNIKMGDRAKKVGKLLDISDMPGVIHGYQLMNFHTDETKWFYEEEKQAFDLWIRGKK